MLFSSPVFFAFFAGYLALHILLPLRFRLFLIVIGSAIFYGYWNPSFVWVPFFMTSVAFAGANWIMYQPNTLLKKRVLIIVLIGLLFPLILVKYSGFLYRDVLGLLFGLSSAVPHWAQWELPLGISFITFTLISYIVDVYRGHYPLERKPLPLSGLVLFFPHLIAGPILRPKELLPQLRRPARHYRIRTTFGVVFFSVGLVKKVCFADPLSEHVDFVFSGSSLDLSGMDYLLAIYAFTVQIYCDFSGYTDMAIGTALMLGVRLPKNFERPYSSISIVDFWKRWHISLSRWLRDYLYIPLGGGRNGPFRRTVNVFITMLLGGLWHGASWTFVLWGLAHAMLISVTHAVARVPVLRELSRLPRWLKVAFTFNIVAYTWILFRAGTTEAAARVATGPFIHSWQEADNWIYLNIFPVSLIISFLLLHRYDSHRLIRKGVQSVPVKILWPLLSAIWILCVSFSQGSSSKFIYFDF